MGPKQIQFLSLILVVYFAEKLIPFRIGQPIAVFVSMLFYYFIGRIAIYCYFTVFTIESILSIPWVYEFARIFPNIVDTAIIIDPTSQDLHNIFSQPGMLDLMMVLLYVMIFVNSGLFFLGSRHIIRKFKIVERLKGLH